MHDSLKLTVTIRRQAVLAAPERPSIFQRPSYYTKGGIHSQLAVSVHLCALSKSDKNCFRSRMVLRYKMH